MKKELERALEMTYIHLNIARDSLNHKFKIKTTEEVQVANQYMFYANQSFDEVVEIISTLQTKCDPS